MGRGTKIGDVEFPEPPWAPGPTEMNDWAFFAFRGEKKGDEKDKKKEKKYLKNPYVHIDLDTTKNDALKDGILHVLLPGRRIKEDFDVVVTAEKILRALRRIKYKNVNEIKIDHETIYRHPDDLDDVEKILQYLIDRQDKWADAKELVIKASHEDPKECVAVIQIQREHSKREHAVEVEFDGEIKRRKFMLFINYLKKNLDIENVEKAK